MALGGDNGFHIWKAVVSYSGLKIYTSPCKTNLAVVYILHADYTIDCQLAHIPPAL